jgi:hypothetical protein
MTVKKTIKKSPVKSTSKKSPVKRVSSKSPPKNENFFQKNFNESFPSFSMFKKSKRETKKVEGNFFQRKLKETFPNFKQPEKFKAFVAKYKDNRVRDALKALPYLLLSMTMITMKNAALVEFMARTYKGYTNNLKIKGDPELMTPLELKQHRRNNDIIDHITVVGDESLSVMKNLSFLERAIVGASTVSFLLNDIPDILNRVNNIPPSTSTSETIKNFFVNLKGIDKVVSKT